MNYNYYNFLNLWGRRQQPRNFDAGEARLMLSIIQIEMRGIVECFGLVQV